MAGISFVSALSYPSLFSRSSLPSPSSSRFQVQVCCLHTKDEELSAVSDGQLQLKRRDLVGCFSSVVALEMIASSGGEATAAGLIEHRQSSDSQSSVKDTPYNAIKARNYLDYGAELFADGKIV